MKHFLKYALPCLALASFGCSQTVDASRPLPDASGNDVPAADVAPADDAPFGDDAPATKDAPATEDAPARWMPPAGTDPTCVSGTTWTRGNRGSTAMNPGQACIACHARNARAPAYTAAGTAYFLDHEVDNCNGYTGAAPEGPSGTATVEVVDAMGRTVRMTVNAVGNFYTRNALTFPLRTARVIGPTGIVAEMGSPVPHGDCNGCHTAEGTNTGMGDPAPGRVIVPL